MTTLDVEPARLPGVTLPEAPSACKLEGDWQWGRYRTPIARPALGAWGPRKWRLKEWHYTSLVTDRLFVAVGLVQLGYVANAFVYLVDRERPDVLHEYEALSMLGRHLRFAPSSVEGETRWTRRGVDLRVGWARQRWELALDVELGGARLVGNARLHAEGDALALLHDVGSARPAYTHKQVGLPASGTLRWGEASFDLSGAVAASDWTRSFAARETRWKWACFAGEIEGARVGLNLSADVYDDAQGDSQENALWRDGQVQPLGGVVFEVPRTPGVDDWRIRSRRGDEVDLTFRPLGARAQHLDLRMVRSDFVQPYGLFRGRVAGVPIDGLFGVVEDHHSVW